MKRYDVGIKRSTIIGIAVALALSSVILTTANIEGVITITQPPKIIDFNVTLVNGTRLSMQELKGKAVLLVFFDTWCSHCRDEVPELFKIYNASAEQATIIMVSTGVGGDNLDQINAFKTEFKIPWLVGLDQDQYYTRLGIKSVPFIFILDAEGKPTYSNSGEVSGEELLSHLST